MILEWLRLAPLLLFAAEHRGFKARSMEWASAPETRISVRDRKSTRLNSSHSQISYAVFCLKKKKKPQNQVCVIRGRLQAIFFIEVAVATHFLDFACNCLHVLELALCCHAHQLFALTFASVA